MTSPSRVWLCEPVDCSRPDSSVHGTLQARVLEWVAICFSRGSSWPRDWTWVVQIVGRCFIIWATRDVHLISLIAISLFRTSVSSWGASLLAQRVKNLPAMQETWVWSLEKGMATHTQYFCLENSMDRGAWQSIVRGHKESGLSN